MRLYKSVIKRGIQRREWGSKSQDKDKGIAHLTRVANVLEDGYPDGNGDGHGNRG